jgi:GNAT superfamily N-acetyltransferase
MDEAQQSCSSPAIRPAHLEDSDVLQGLLTSLDQETPPAADHARACLQRCQDNPNCTVFLAWDGDRAVGTYSLYLLETVGHGGAFFAVVESVVVCPRQRGTGIGRCMMTHARYQAQAAGCYKLMLSSNVKRQDAHRFYDALGFTRHGYSFSVDID